MKFLWPVITGILSLVVIIGAVLSLRSTPASSQLVDFPEDTRLLTMRAPEMFCGGCAWSVEGALRPVPGILSADVTISTKEVSIIYDPKQITSDQILSQSIFDAYGREFIRDNIYSP